MRIVLLSVLFLPTLVLATTKPGAAATNVFVTKLLAKMTPEEKVGQLTQYAADDARADHAVTLRDQVRDEIVAGHVGSLFNVHGAKASREIQRLAVERTRLKIPLLFAFDVVHGYRTIFPIPLAESAAWDLNLVEQTAAASAREAAADGVHWTFAPMVDVTRDPRWGRVMGGAGEDPWLGAKIAAARVRGIQGKDVGDGRHLLATVKHFAAYGALTAGREYAPTEISARELAEVYLPPYEAAVKAGATTVMTASNALNGRPPSADRTLLTDLLRRRWGFDGLILSDYSALPQLVQHGVAEDNRDAARISFTAGVDVDVQGGVFGGSLARLVKEGKVNRGALDAAVRRVLELKYRLGLFTDPYRFANENAAQLEALASEHRKLARDAARRSIVLLKNDDGALPLKRAGTIAVIGPFADDKRSVTGSYDAVVEQTKSVSLLEGLREATEGTATIVHARGANLLEDQGLIDLLNASGGDIQKDPRTPKAMIDEAVEVAGKADVVIVALGEPVGLTGEASSRTRLRLPINQEDLLLALHKAGKPLTLVLSNGRPLALELENELAHAIVEGWYLGSESGHALADVLFGDVSPSGKLTMSFPRHEGQLPMHYASPVTGRPTNAPDRWTAKYVDGGGDALFPFGWGLGYAAFKYAEVHVAPAKLKAGQTARVTVQITNVGTRDAEEVAQLYVHDPVASLTRPAEQLRGFRKVMIKAGATAEVEFALTADDLKFPDAQARWITEPGRFRVLVGGNSADLIETEFQLLK